jgi:hypothetical protein
MRKYLASPEGEAATENYFANILTAGNTIGSTGKANYVDPMKNMLRFFGFSENSKGIEIVLKAVVQGILAGDLDGNAVSQIFGSQLNQPAFKTAILKFNDNYEQELGAKISPNGSVSSFY